ncbi:MULTISPECIES: flagellar hook-basal body complex protein FliE [Anoxybacillus]|uniref:Flagellar hook-basal body complex protein FliE n=1 Tax=Anoxybacillus kestanbolensis TaxID=227476 RepID=A0A1V3FNI8_9BACL|nr:MULTISPECIES: flagellar hook-basal body complex protein FliE [Anoxybacillus]NNU89409.1 flagellar hook-basal body complex protein FliE [Anoxybacillus sp. CHMUD]OOE03104.1 flagellar hook-basal body complex protein FliE [Anoxybacillus kestanbolensis]
MIDRIQRAALSPAVQQQTIKPAEAQRAFSQFLKEAIQEVNKQQIQSDQLTMKLARGENVDLHNVMIASQKASVSLQLAIEVRNKVVEAYQEVMRMQV